MAESGALLVGVGGAFSTAHDNKPLSNEDLYMILAIMCFLQILQQFREVI